MCVSVQERGRESLRRRTWAELARRDVGWVRGFTWAHAANVSGVPNAMQQSGAQALSGGGPARSGVESAVRGCGLWVAGAGGLPTPPVSSSINQGSVWLIVISAASLHVVGFLLLFTYFHKGLQLLGSLQVQQCEVV